MATKNKSRQLITNIMLLAVMACIIMLVIYQANQVVDLVTPEPTATRLPVSSGGGGSGIEVQMEDVLPTATPLDVSHQE